MYRVGDTWLPDEDTYFKPFFEKDGFDLDRLREALTFVTDYSVAIDGGAHVGSWSRVMSKYFSMVYSFEPATDTFDCLKRNVFTNMNVVPIHKALGNRQSAVSIKDDKTRAGNTGARYVKEGGHIEMTTIDNLELEDLGFLKLDVEGAEILALEGGKNTILKHNPVIYIESKKGMAERFGRNQNDAMDWIRDNGGKEVATFGNDHVFIMI